MTITIKVMVYNSSAFQRSTVV